MLDEIMFISSQKDMKSSFVGQRIAYQTNCPQSLPPPLRRLLEAPPDKIKEIAELLPIKGQCPAGIGEYLCRDSFNMFKTTLGFVLLASFALASSWAMKIPAAQEHFEFQYQDALARNGIAAMAAPVSRQVDGISGGGTVGRPWAKTQRLGKCQKCFPEFREKF